MTHPPNDKQYLGDGVYVDCDDWRIVLTSENGISVTNTIYLEPEILVRLTDYARKRGLVP